MNNLKQTALAFIIWVDDHEQSELPFRTGWWNGGSSPGPTNRAKPFDAGPEPAWIKAGLPNSSWFQLAWISNELVTPKVLVCPSDKEKRTAEDFGGSSQTGFLNPRHQNNAVSYILPLDGHPSTTERSPLSLEIAAQNLLIADRNLVFQSIPGGVACSSGIRANGELSVPADAQWVPQAKYGHGNRGNVALSDGSVMLAPKLDLREVAGLDFDSGRLHFLIP